MAARQEKYLMLVLYLQLLSCSSFWLNTEAFYFPVSLILPYGTTQVEIVPSIVELKALSGSG